MAVPKGLLLPCVRKKIYVWKYMIVDIYLAFVPLRIMVFAIVQCQWPSQLTPGGTQNLAELSHANFRNSPTWFPLRNRPVSTHYQVVDELDLFFL